MMTLAGSSSLPGRRIIPPLRPLRLNWRRAMLAGLVVFPFFAHSSVYADEVDVLAL